MLICEVNMVLNFIVWYLAIGVGMGIWIGFTSSPDVWQNLYSLVLQSYQDTWGIEVTVGDGYEKEILLSMRVAIVFVSLFLWLFFVANDFYVWHENKLQINPLIGL
jgi:hypothetical protein